MTSQAYQPIDTQLIIDTAHKQATAAGLQLTVERGGYRGVYSYTFGDSFTVGDSGLLKSQLFIRNINDGAHALMIGVGLYRFICANGLVVGDDFYSERIIHRKGQKVDQFLANLDENFRRAFEVGAAGGIADSIVALQEKTVTENDGIAIIASLPVPTTIREVSINNWVRPIRAEDTQRSIWSLYNTVNEANRRLARGQATFDRELSLLQHIEALHEDQLVRQAA